MPSASTSHSDSTIDAADVARFTAIAAEWWDERGKFAPLHRLNPARICAIRDHIFQHFHAAATSHGQSATPLQNLSLLDVGCGGGLIAEPMCRLGATVTGIDAGAQNIAVAALHAKSAGLAIDYRETTAEALANQNAQFDVVLALEIIEHVANPALFYDALVALVKPGGVLILSTLNRTVKSYAMAIIGAEYILRWLPRGTHDWKKFIKPSEMADMLTRRGLKVTDVMGIVYRPLTREFAIDRHDLDVNYLLFSCK
ncbi:MAG: bifunctional 3-demethylubiquinol 3-O-methyltransferase/2-polyprenyl-6-hydroxyphenol methylase [Rhodospirillales bacterium 12-54-5]|nr:MAG: bifunctional 3-demethylubiquinol 3-O-methyltransferase/2-polyprenyl-6-hydroxyphenol methylase [Rhodospirillales bacterium 12-54-5]